jgi:hypothetical protein
MYHEKKSCDYNPMFIHPDPFRWYGLLPKRQRPRREPLVGARLEPLAGALLGGGKGALIGAGVGALGGAWPMMPWRREGE